MILAISRFRVANGMQSAVKKAFFNRPHLVDSAPGFLGMETFTDSDDSTTFYLVTRWTDANSFRSWHRSKDHRLSHQYIPKGLKLDPAYTELLILNRLSEEGRFYPLDEAVTDSSQLITSFLSHSNSFFFLVVDKEARITACNEALLSRLKKGSDEVIGCSVGSILTDTDTSLLLGEFMSRERPPEKRLLLNFVGNNSGPFTLECQIDIRPDGFTLLGTPQADKEQALQDELLELNNRLAVLARENARQNKLLKKALVEKDKAYEELEKTHWHLRKIQEVLPICMMCSKVKTGEGQWDELIKFMKDNSDFLSHGYCPECALQLMAEVKGLRRQRKEEE